MCYVLEKKAHRLREGSFEAVLVSEFATEPT